ncbi:hypothetical protein BYT27DRAFT_7247900 [Phlegmacium glaucopus]|nr:hypothetical protein BYT27DRAFT_7247900 [Phlegmacium glaucopus]
MGRVYIGYFGGTRLLAFKWLRPKLFNLVLMQLLTLVKKSLHKYNFLALDWIVPKIRMGLRKDGALCLCSFPEFLADLKLGAMARGSDMGTKLIDFTISTVKYIEKIPHVQTAIESALLALGDGNWKMGEGIQVGKGVKTDKVDHSNIIKHFVHDIILTAINSLVTLSRTSRCPAFGSIFLLNNISYLWLHLLESSNPNLFTFVPKPAEEALNSKFRIAKAGYFESNFSPLMQALSEDPRDKYEVGEQHKLVVVLEDDVDGRDAIRDEVVMVVISSFQKFTQKQKDKEFSKNPQKYELNPLHLRDGRVELTF